MKKSACKVKKVSNMHSDFTKEVKMVFIMLIEYRHSNSRGYDHLILLVIAMFVVTAGDVGYITELAQHAIQEASKNNDMLDKMAA